MTILEAVKPPLSEPDALLRYYVRHRREFIEDWFLIEHRDTLQQIPFRFRPVQEDYWQRMKDGTTRLVVVKSRQAEVSSITEADYTSLAMLTPGLRVLAVVQKPEHETIPHHMARIIRFFYSVPEPLRPEVVNESQSQIVMGFGGTKSHPEFTSSIQFISCGSPDAPRGGTFHFVHLTEYDSYETKEAEGIFRSLAGLPASSTVVIESSPKHSLGPLHRIYSSAKNRQGAFEAALYPWHWVPEYSLGGDSPIEDITAPEADLMRSESLSYGNIRWRRRKIDEARDEFGEEAESEFLIEHLEDDIRCWAMVGRPAMPQSYLDTLLSRVQNPLYSDHGLKGLRVWLPPENGESYIVMGDPAEGLAWGHESAIIVRRLSDWRHCATWSGHNTPGEFGALLVGIGMLYNTALIGWERNNHGHGVHERVVEQLRYPLIYRYKGIGDQAGDERTGFPTSHWTKAPLVSVVHESMLTGTWHSWDMKLIGQYRTLQDLGDGKYDTDVLDLCMADLLCHAARNQGMRMRYSHTPKKDAKPFAARFLLRR